jgi:protein-tyrosine phosphatase
VCHENEVKTFLEWVRASYRKGLVNRGIDPHWLTHRIRLNSSFADFYLVWAMEREAMGSELEGPVGNLRHRIHAELASVMTCYLTAAIIREFNDSETRGAAYVCARDDLDWIESRCDAFAGTYRLAETMETISRLDISDQAGFFRHAAAIFRKGHWEIAFCGEPWAIIADIVAAYLDGVIPDDTTFVDQTFNLQHHGGRLFDKHPLVKNEFSNETVLRGQLNENLTASSIEDLFETVCFSSSAEGFQFAPSEEVMNIWKQGVKIGLWKERDKGDKDARVCRMATEKMHESHRGTPVNVGPFTVYAAGMHDIGKHDLDKFRTETNAVLVLLSDDRIEWHGNPTDYTILAKPLSDLGGVPDDWREFLLRLFDLLVAGKRLLIACSKGHGRTGCCIASLIALVESADRTPDPIAAVRQRHCIEAVETRKQAEAIFAIRNEPVPTRYWPQFPERKNRGATVPEPPEIEFAP